MFNNSDKFFSWINLTKCRIERKVCKLWRNISVSVWTRVEPRSPTNHKHTNHTVGCLLPPGRQETIRTEVATSGLFVGRKIGLILAQPQPSHHILGSLNVSQNHFARRQIGLLFRSAQQKFLILCLENKSWKLNSVNFVEMHFSEFPISLRWRKWRIFVEFHICRIVAGGSSGSAAAQLRHRYWVSNWSQACAQQPSPALGQLSAQTHKTWWKLPQNVLPIPFLLIHPAAPAHSTLHTVHWLQTRVLVWGKKG